MRLVLGLALWLVAGAVALGGEPRWPALTGRVVDEAGVIEPAAEARLARALEAHERATGDQVVVATVGSLQGLDVEEYANRLFRAWALGQAGEDDGVLLLVAPGERKVRIEVGYGLEGELTDAAASAVIQSLILPRFRAGDLSGGIEAGANGVVELLAAAAGGEPAPGWAAAQGQGGSERFGQIVQLVLLAGFAIAVVLIQRRTDRRQRRYRPGWGGPPIIITSGGSDWGSRSSGGGGFSGGGGSSGGGGASGSW